MSRGNGRVVPELTVVVVCLLPHGGEGVCGGRWAGLQVAGKFQQPCDLMQLALASLVAALTQPAQILTKHFNLVVGNNFIVNVKTRQPYSKINSMLLSFRS